MLGGFYHVSGGFDRSLGITGMEWPFVGGGNGGSAIMPVSASCGLCSVSAVGRIRVCRESSRVLERSTSGLSEA